MVGLCTFIDGDDVWMTERGHDFNFSTNVNQVLLILDLLLPNGLYGDLNKREREKKTDKSSLHHQTRNGLKLN